MRFRSLLLLFSSILLLTESGIGQSSDFPYRVELEEVRHTNWPTLHSYALAMSKGRCLIIGGRRDGLHARQPFRSFPAGERNSRIYFLDPQSGKQYSAGLESLPQQLREQLSSSNMNFIQRGDRLFLTGGYGFSESADDHITFPLLTVVNIPQLVRQLEAGRVDSLPFRTYRDERFAVTGGRMGAFGDTLMIVGGHRFDGRYNPMGHATYVQAYTHEARRFLFTRANDAPIFLPPLSEPLHLRRRDFNLVPFMSRDGSTGYTMAAGVFQRGMELPYLYPVDIRGDHIRAVTGFQQFLCSYHTAFTPLHDPRSGTTHTLFFGGISEYHPDNGRLVRDDRVPFVKTISRLERTEDGQYKEYLLTTTMPKMTGAASEFIPDPVNALASNGMILFNSSMQVRWKIGYLYGGIESNQPNPFDEDETDEATRASGNLFAVWLIPDTTQADRLVGGENPYTFEVLRDSTNAMTLSYELQESTRIKVLFTDMNGDEFSEMEEEQRASGPHRVRYRLDSGGNFKYEFVSIVFNKRFIVTRPIY